MKKTSEKICSFLADLIVCTAEKKAHTACHGYMYEPSVPKKIIEERKNEK